MAKEVAVEKRVPSTCGRKEGAARPVTDQEGE